VDHNSKASVRLAFDFVVSDALQNPSEPCLWIDHVQLGSFDQGEGAPHISHTGSKPDTRIARYGDHETKPFNKRASASPSKSPSTVRRCPSVVTISMRGPDIGSRHPHRSWVDAEDVDDEFELTVFVRQLL
jgi:hypothetical protein